MITVGSRDGRKGLGLGFGVGREMEETELEEGEACSYQDEDASIDPDVALSYIDEKLQNVLGHFQKDFEGGVSAENLGAKFGGYGSFLPTYQRSPGLSHPRTPPKVHNHNIFGSPKSSQPEGGHNNSVVSTSAHLVRHGPATTNIVTLPVTTAPSLHDSHRDGYMTHAEGFDRRSETENRSANLPEQKPLKVRIKVGSDNLSTQKNAAIYSGLGLDVSPTSSLEDSPTESEGLCRAPQGAPDESPNSILQMMTSFPIYGGLLLSPLPDDLIRLTQKEKLLRDNRCGPVPEGGRGSSVILVNGSDSIRGEWKVLGQKKTRPSEKSNISLELKNVNGKVCQSGTGVIKRKEADIDTLACEELVSNALKLPLISNSYGTVSDLAKGAVRVSDVSREAQKDIVKEKNFSDISKEEPLETIRTQVVGGVENSTGKVASAAKVWEDTKENSIGDVNRKGEKSYDSVKADSNAFKGRKAANSEVIDHLKLKTDQKATSKEQNGMSQLAGKEHPASGEKKKSKGSKSHDALAAEIPKERSAYKTKKGTPAENNFSRSESENLRLQKDFGNARDRYRDFFGDIPLEQEGNVVDSLEIPSKGRVKDFEVNEKNRFASNNGSKERLSGKKIEKSSTTEAYSKAASNFATFAGNGPVSDAAPPTVAPVDNNDNWVCCDKCQQWRLLPIGTNPDDLPDNWLCSMLNWLPGMNRCSFTQEETTKAVVALNHAPPSQSQNNLQIRLDGNVSGVIPADVRYPDKNHQHLNFHAVHSEAKKHETKEILDVIDQDDPAQLPFLMKNVQPSVKSRSLNEVNQSPLVNEIDFQSRKSSDSAVEKHRSKKKDKNKLLEQYSEGGNTKNSKKKSKRENDQDSFGASKKSKKEGMQYTDDDWMPELGGAIRKADPSSSNGLPTDVAGKDQSNYKHPFSSKDLKCDGKDNFKVSIKKMRDKVQVPLDDRPLDLKKTDNIDIVAKKRKVKECEDSQVYSGSLPSTGYHLQDSRVFAKEESSENDHRKEKKARVPKYDGKDSIISKGNGRSDKKGSTRKDHQVGQDLEKALSQQNLDGMDYLKRDLGSSQPVAATSSSSKVSGSHKSKTNFQEVKGSPVESVSSSPLRILNIDKLATGRMNLVEKDDPGDARFFTNTGSPRRCSEGEDDGGSDRSGTVRKDKSITITQHGSHESSVLDFQDRDFSHLSDSKTKAQVVASPEVTKGHFLNGNADILGQYSSKPQAVDRCRDEGRRNDNHYHASGSHSRKSGKGSSSRSKDKIRSSKSEYDKHKNTDSVNASQDHALPYEEKAKDGKSKFQEKCGFDSRKDEKKNAHKRDSGVKLSGDSKREYHSKSGGYNGPDVKVDCSQDAIYIPKQNLLRDHDGEKSPKIFLSDKNDRAEIISGRGRSVPLPPSGRGQNDTQTRFQRQIPVSFKENGAGILSIDSASEGDDALKGSKQTRKAENENGGQQINSRHATPNGQRVRDPECSSPVRRDSSSQAATNAVKEAKDLKHLADRLKNSGSNHESTGLYFQSALKFLHGASLLESCNSENSKHADQSMQMYSSTAKLCEFCAHEYERCKDMAAAALAYKCMEVAYMRVIYSSHSSASRDRHELHTALQMVPPGESPSSSASDVDNLNNVATVDKVAIAKGVCSPQVTGNHIIAARNRPSFVRLLNYAQDVNFAMEASRKSRIAFGAANVSMEGTQHMEISSIKRALDFNFQDVEGLLRLVRIAMEVVSR